MTICSSRPKVEDGSNDAGNTNPLDASPRARPPSAERAARYLGFSAHEIPILVQKRLLTPLGHPAKNNVRYFAAVTLQELRQDVKWLAKATDATSEAWRIKNAKSAAAKERADQKASAARSQASPAVHA